MTLQQELLINTNFIDSDLKPFSIILIITFIRFNDYRKHSLRERLK